VSDLVIRGERVVVPGGIQPLSIHVRDGRIVALRPYTERPAGVDTIDAGSLVVLPGLVDTHVHINDPGRADWEGFEHGTRAAAAGGVTMLIDMPLNSVPSTTTVAGLDAKRQAASGRCFVDVGFWGGIVPGSAAELEPLARAGVLGFKCFLSPSGVDEFQHVSETDLREAMPVIARLGLPLLAHSESPLLLTDPSSSDPRKHDSWLRSRPPESEVAAIALVIDLARQFGTRVHIVHLAAPDALPIIAAARNAGVAMTVETCPHYLSFCAEEIPDGATPFKCAPPIRERERRERLWQALERGEIDLIATDHSPAPPALKGLADGDFVRAWGGIASLQLGLAAVWTGAAARGVPIERMARWLSETPAQLAGLAARKGAIAAGRDADFAIVDPDATYLVDPAALHHRHPITPYAGLTLRGVVRQTILRGQRIFEEGSVTSVRSGVLVYNPHLA
jgi:allantoinase